MKSQLFVVSTGPSHSSLMTKEAIDILKSSEVIVGYKKYIDEIGTLLDGKETFVSNMTEELKRCQMAIELALSGKKVSIISNGDVNVFAMASLVVELVEKLDLSDKLDVVSVAGVTTLLAIASKCGAPISQDFAVISLSDRLTLIEVIQKRIRCAIEGDFVLGIYNPLSKTRKEPYRLFLEELKAKESETPVIIASNISRESEQITYMNLKQLIEMGVSNPLISMSTTLIIGNDSSYFTKDGKVLTPRGYLNKYKIDKKEI
jgi:precorrin-3B C17-methyltransferase